MLLQVKGSGVIGLSPNTAFADSIVFIVLYLVANGLHEMAFQTVELKHYIDLP